jgi:hypothetical protein
MTLKTNSGALYIKTKSGVQKIFPPSLPGVVGGLSNKTTHNTIDFDWADLPNIVGNPLIGYVVKLNGNVIDNIPNSQSQYTFSNLTPDTNYTISIAGKNPLGIGPYIDTIIKTGTAPSSGGGDTPTPPPAGNLLSAAQYDAGSDASAFILRGTGATLSVSTEWSSVGGSSIKTVVGSGSNGSTGPRTATNFPVAGNAYHKFKVVVNSGKSSKPYTLSVTWLNSAGKNLGSYRSNPSTIAAGTFKELSMELASPIDATQAFLAVQSNPDSGTFASGDFFYVDEFYAEQTGTTQPNTNNKILAYERPLTGMFGANSWWKWDVSDAPLHANSALMIEDLVTNQLEPYYGGIATFNTHQYNATVYVVDADMPTMNLGFCDAQRKGYVPGELYNTSGLAFLRNVPVPVDAMSGGGGDGHIAIWRPATDELWEYWQFWRDRQQDGGYGGVTWAAANNLDFGYKTSAQLAAATTNKWAGYSVTWGGKISNISQNPGLFPWPSGASATGLCYMDGSIGLNEAAAGKIEHALALSLPAPKKNVFSWPATRTDGPSTNTYAIPEGLRLRMDPTINFDTQYLSLHPLARMMAKAAQKYGCIVTDKSGVVEFEGESTQHYIRRGLTDPWSALLNGTPGYNILKNFPWSKMQALPMDYGKPA